MALQLCPHCGCNLSRFDPLRLGNVEIDERGEIVFAGHMVRLARTQRAIVEALIQARGRYLTRGALANVVGGEIADQSVSKYIERARTAFRTIEPQFDQIVAIKGIGAYKWRLSAH